MQTNAIKIALATDHGGYELKEGVKKVLEQQGYKILDYGCNSLKVSIIQIIFKSGMGSSSKSAQFGIVFVDQG